MKAENETTIRLGMLKLWQIRLWFQKETRTRIGWDDLASLVQTALLLHETTLHEDWQAHIRQQRPRA